MTREALDENCCSTEELCQACRSGSRSMRLYPCCQSPAAKLFPVWHLKNLICVDVYFLLQGSFAAMSSAVLGPPSPVSCLTVASSSCLKRSVGTSQMRCLAKILSLIPTSAVQSALKSAVVPSLHSVRQGSQSVLQSWLMPGLGLPALAPCVESGDPAPAVSMEKLCWSPGWEGQSA